MVTAAALAVLLLSAALRRRAWSALSTALAGLSSALLSTVLTGLSFAVLTGLSFAVLAGLSFAVSAETEKVPPPTLRHSLVVSASLAPEALGENARECVVLEGEWLKDLPVRTLGDVLALAAPVDLQCRTPDGLQADIRLRGSNFSGVLVCVDGVRWSDPQTAHFNLELPVPWAMVERVEILTGSQSVFFGSEAVGGVVNLVTRKPGPARVAGEVGGGSFGSGWGVGQAEGRREGLGGCVYAEFNRTDGFAPDRDGRYERIFGRLDAEAGLFGFRLAGGFLDHHFGAAGFYGPYPSYEATRTFSLALNTALREGWGKDHQFTLDLAWRRHDDDFILFRDRPEYYRNIHATDVLLARCASYLVQGPKGSLAVLGEASGEWIRSARLGDHARGRGALAADALFTPRPGLTLQAGLRGDLYSAYGADWSPGAGASWFAAPRLKLRASAGRAFRVPSFTELYYWSPTLRGNPNLHPEKAMTVDGGFDWFFAPRAAFSATVFRRWEHDLIDYVRAGSADPWVAENLRRTVVDGVSLQASWQPAAWLRTQAGYAWLDSGLSPVGRQSRYTADFARHVATLAADFFPDRRLRPSVTLRYKHRALTGEGYVVLSAALSGFCGPWELSLRVDNAADATYQELSGVAMPGRGFFATLRFHP